jgi:uncharacterized protein YbjT (DUF2867 family)
VLRGRATPTARAAEGGAFEVTILRPGHTYGPGSAMDDQQESDSGTWDRVARGLPVLVAGDGLGLWQWTHRDDCALLFAHAALNPKTYGQTYNATRDEVLTWRDYYREIARALDTRAKVVFVPARWLLAQAPERFSFLAQIAQFHCAYQGPLISRRRRVRHQHHALGIGLRRDEAHLHWKAFVSPNALRDSRTGDRSNA